MESNSNVNRKEGSLKVGYKIQDTSFILNEIGDTVPHIGSQCQCYSGRVTFQECLS